MAVSDIEICNRGLRHIGQATITSFTDNTQPARDCQLFYKQNVDIVLRDFPWNFAHAKKALQDFTVPVDYEGKYAYAYTIPTDCLKTRDIYETLGTESQPFELMRVPTGEEILFTDVKEAILSYTMKVTASEWFDAEFAQSLSLMMAASLALSITKSYKLAEIMDKRYMMTLPKAEVSNAKEDSPKEDYEDSWISARV